MANTTCPVCAASLPHDAQACPACDQALSFSCRHCNSAVPLLGDAPCPNCERKVDDDRAIALCLAFGRHALDRSRREGDPTRQAAVLQDALDRAAGLLERFTRERELKRITQQLVEAMEGCLTPLAEAHAQSGRGMAAMDCLSRWLERHPDDVVIAMRKAELAKQRQAFLERAEAARTLGDYEAFVETLRQGQALFEDDPTFQERIDQLKSQQEEVAERMARLEELAQARRHHDLLEQVEALLVIAPRHPRALMLQARAREAIDKAQEQIERARAKLADNQFAAATSCVRAAQALLNDPSGAEEILEQAQQAEQAALDSLEAARHALATGQFKQAEQLRSQALSRGAPLRECGLLEREIEQAQLEGNRRLVRGVALGAAGVLVAVIVLLLAGFLLRGYSQRADVQRGVQNARQFLERDDPDAAERELTRIATRYPDRVDDETIATLRKRITLARGEQRLADLGRALAAAREPEQELALLDRYAAQQWAEVYGDILAASREDALRRRREAAFERLRRQEAAMGDRRLDEVDALYEAFIRQYPDTPQALAAQAWRDERPQREAEVAYQGLLREIEDASPLFAADRCAVFLRRHPDSPHAEEVRAMREAFLATQRQRAFQAAMDRIAAAQGNSAAITAAGADFLRRFPESEEAERIRDILDELPARDEAAAHARLRDEVAAAASPLEIIAAYDRFLSTYSRGQHAEAVRQERESAMREHRRQRLADLEQKLAQADSDEAVTMMVDAFLNGEGSEEVVERAEAMRQDALEALAEQRMSRMLERLFEEDLNRGEALALSDRFLEQYAESPGAPAVSERRERLLAQWEDELFERVLDASAAAVLEPARLEEQARAYLRQRPDGRHAEQVRAIVQEAARQQVVRDHATLRADLAEMPPGDHLRRVERIGRFLEAHGDAPQAEMVRDNHVEEIEAGYQFSLRQAQSALDRGDRRLATLSVLQALHLKPNGVEARALYDSLPESLRPTPRPPVQVDPHHYMDRLRGG